MAVPPLPVIKVGFGFGNYDDTSFDLVQESDGSGTVRMDLSGVFSASSYALRHTLRAGYNSRLSSALKGRASLNNDVTKNWKLRVPIGLEITGIGGETSDQYVSDDPYGYSITRGPYDVPNGTIIDITIDGTVYNVPLKQADGRTAHSIVDEIRSVIGTDGGSVGDAYVQYDTYSEANRIYIYSRGHKKIDIETKIDGTASRAVFRWSVLGTPAPDEREGSIWDPTSDAREAMAFSDWEKVGESLGYQIYQMKTGLTHTVLGDKDRNYGRVLSKGRFDRYGRSRMMENTWLSFHLPIEIDFLKEAVLGRTTGELAPFTSSLTDAIVEGVIDIDRLRDEAGWTDFQSKDDTLYANAREAIGYISDLISRPVIAEDWEFYVNQPLDKYGQWDSDGYMCIAMSDFKELRYVRYFSKDETERNSRRRFEVDGEIDLGSLDTDYVNGVLRIWCDADGGWPSADTEHYEYGYRVSVRRQIDFENSANQVIKNAMFHYALGLCRGEPLAKLVENVKFELADGFYQNGMPRIRRPVKDREAIGKKVL